jgi:hypothetical protein
MVVFNTYYKNKKSKLHFENRVTVPNDLIYGYGGSTLSHHQKCSHNRLFNIYETLTETA